MYSAWSAWTVSISASTQTIAASGGSSTITTSASRSRTWTWNGVGTTHTDTETATPTLSGSAGGFTLSGKTVTASNNTTTNSRSITITATSNSVSKSITITQSAGTKVYTNWSAWNVNISADKTSIGATGGTATISASASRLRNYTWNGVADSGGTEMENETPTLSKVSGSGNWTSPKVTYGNNTSTSDKSTVIRATIDSTTKDITISQSAGSKSYGSWSSWSVYCNASSYTVAASGGSVTIYYGASRSRTWTWNGVAGSGGTEIVYYNPDDVNVTNKVNCDVSVANAFNYASMIIITFKPSANNSYTAREYKIEWNWLNHNVITKGTQRANPMRGRLVIKNDYFTSQNIALPIHLDTKNVDSIYKGETSYNDIKRTPIDICVYIPTNISIMNGGKLQFWFENKDSGSKYTCTLSNVTIPINNISVSNSNNIISVTANTTIYSFTMLCQFTMTSNSTVFNVRVIIG